MPTAVNPSAASRSGSMPIGTASRRPNTVYRDAARTAASSTNSRYSRAKMYRPRLVTKNLRIPASFR